MNKQCFKCDLKHVDKLQSILSFDNTIANQLKNIINTKLKNCDMTKTNPEIMGELWQDIIKEIQNDDPYKEIKSLYNQYVVTLLPQIKQNIDSNLLTALKTTIAANLIDFSAKDSISKKEIATTLLSAQKLNLAIDDSKSLFKQLKTARNLVYLADNCGEIVLDKLFITMLKQNYSQLNIYYVTCGIPVVNDVTIIDAIEVGIDKIATVISNGDCSLGTVYQRTSQQFKRTFNSSDLVIAKGQGNFESLCDFPKDNLYFLFMAKCPLVASIINVNVGDIVCLKH